MWFWCVLAVFLNLGEDGLSAAKAGISDVCLNFCQCRTLARPQPSNPQSSQSVSQRGTNTQETEQRPSPAARYSQGRPSQPRPEPPGGWGGWSGGRPAGRYLSRGAAPSASRCRCGRRGAPGRPGGCCRPPPAGTGSHRRASHAAAPWWGRGRGR